MVNLSLLVDEEFLKVPLDASETKETWFLLLEETVERVCIIAVDFYLVHDRERDSI